jgi:hypothetical protein
MRELSKGPFSALNDPEDSGNSERVKRCRGRQNVAGDARRNWRDLLHRVASGGNDDVVADRFRERHRWDDAPAVDHVAARGANRSRTQRRRLVAARASYATREPRATRPARWLASVVSRPCPEASR